MIIFKKLGKNELILIFITKIFSFDAFPQISPDYFFDDEFENSFTSENKLEQILSFVQDGDLNSSLRL